MSNEPALTVLSLGAGVQSTCMALMADRGAFGRVPDCAIFADTDWEPPDVYEHLDWLEGELSYPVHRVNRGRSLRQDLLDGVNHTGHNFIDIPVFLRAHGGYTDGMGLRQCTLRYKIDPIRRKVREMIGMKKGQKVPAGVYVEQWIGISTDEIERAKPAREKWLRTRWPLIEQNLSRIDLVNWFREHYPGRELVKSACVGCPYQSRNQWVEKKRQHPEAFAEAVEIDRRLRNTGPRKKVPFLHVRRRPLDEAVALDEQNHGVQMAFDGFANECEGHCGV